LTLYRISNWAIDRCCVGVLTANYKKRLAKDESGTATLTAAPKTMQVATMTTDFAVGGSRQKIQVHL
jgi:hypothetical protein